MPDIDAVAYDMEWWCTVGNLGYDQYNRWDLRVGGETDCSAFIISVLKARGFDVGGATYTGNMARELTQRGWVMLDPDVELERGDILLNHANHVAMYIGRGLLAQASIDERGEIAGGASGDQADETNIRAYYDYPWDCVLRYTGGYTLGTDWEGSGSRWNPNGYDENYVRGIQQKLVEAGYDIGPDGADGVLGENTFNAIKQYQEDHGGLQADGIPGPQTRAALHGEIVIPQAAHKPGVDGYWGEQTTRMLQAYLGTPTDGVISSQAAVMRDDLPGCTSGWEFVPDMDAEGSLAIHALQDRLGVESDGLVGPNTVNALSALYGLEGDGRLDAPSMTISAMQQHLIEKGSL